MRGQRRLNAARRLEGAQTPAVGVNIGRLGFLADLDGNFMGVYRTTNGGTAWTHAYRNGHVHITKALEAVKAPGRLEQVHLSPFSESMSARCLPARRCCRAAAARSTRR